jgi:hypothetical protein
MKSRCLARKLCMRWQWQSRQSRQSRAARKLPRQAPCSLHVRWASPKLAQINFLSTALQFRDFAKLRKQAALLLPPPPPQPRIDAQ